MKGRIVGPWFGRFVGFCAGSLEVWLGDKVRTLFLGDN